MKKESYNGFKSILKIISTIFSWIAFIILIIIAVLLIFYVVSLKAANSKGEEYEPPIALYTIISPSMEPVIKVYDVIINVKVDSIESLKKGDVITFISTSSLSSGMTVTHRIDEIIQEDGETKIRTKGDNNLAVDSALVSEKDILGKVIFKVPQLGRLQLLLASKGGWLFLILIPALCIIIYDILKVFKLVGVKNKVEKINELENVEDHEQKLREQERKKLLKQKLENQMEAALPLEQQPQVESTKIEEKNETLEENLLMNDNQAPVVKKDDDDQMELPKLKE